MEWILQKAQSFLVWFQGLNLFGQIPPLALAFILFVVFVLCIFFFYWRARWVARYQSFKYRTFWEPLVLSIVVIGIFIYLFEERLLIEMDQDTVRNLILLTAGVIGWYFLYQRTKTGDQSKRAAEKSAEATRKNAETTEKGLTIERLTRAIDQLAHEKISIRLGGIRSLEQIADTHEEERTKIMEILSARIRELAPIDYTQPDKNRLERLDVETALKVLAKIAKPFGEEKAEFCELSRTDLSGLVFFNIDLSYFDLQYANLSETFLMEVNFDGARLDRVNISGTIFRGPAGTIADPRIPPFYLKGNPPMDSKKLPRGLHPEERETVPEDN